MSPDRPTNVIRKDNIHDLSHWSLIKSVIVYISVGSRCSEVLYYFIPSVYVQLGLVGINSNTVSKWLNERRVVSKVYDVEFFEFLVSIGKIR